MQPVSYGRHQLPPEIIRHPIWLYLRFTLSYREVEELLAEPGVEVSYETVRRWVLKIGPTFWQPAPTTGQTYKHMARGRDGSLYPRSTHEPMASRAAKARFWTSSSSPSGTRLPP